MRDLAFVVLGFVLLVVQGAIGALFPLGPWAPSPLLAIVLYLGVTHDVYIVRGAIGAFILGSLLDSFSGSPMGLSTFVMVAAFLIARGAGLNLFMRGPLFQVALTFAFSVMTGGAVLALRAIFEPQAPFPLNSISEMVLSLVLGALVTGVISPALFVLIRRVDGLVTRRREESTAV